MNVENLRRLRDFINALPEHNFNMDIWVVDQFEGEPTKTDGFEHRCGTVACIGGWASLLFSDKRVGLDDDPLDQALGITVQEALDLFHMLNTKFTFDDATKASGVRVLDIMIETGKVDWDRAITEERAHEAV